MLEGISDLFIAKGKKTLHVDLASQRPSDEELLGLLLGRAGKLRAPTIRTGSRLLVGYNQDMLTDHLLNPITLTR